MRTSLVALLTAAAMSLSVPAMAQDAGQMLSKQQIMTVQQDLNKKGFSAGPVDGVLGADTKTALENFQKKQGITPTGKLDSKTLSALGVHMRQAKNTKSGGGSNSNGGGGSNGGK